MEQQTAQLDPHPVKTPARKRQFFLLRVTVLLMALLIVSLYALADYRKRQARLNWQRSLQVALVLIEVSPVTEQALALFSERTATLESVLEREFNRHGGAFAPINFHEFGPIPGDCPRPRPREEPEWLQALRFAWSLHRQTAQLDTRLALDTSGYDARVYVCVAPPRSDDRAFVEGTSQNGGYIGIALVELSEASVDFALFVVAHELLHVLGAQDRYGPDGLTLLPDGLAEPDREPLFPQLFTEVMARGRPIAPAEEAPPDELEELRVGDLTATEIGWR